MIFPIFRQILFVLLAGAASGSVAADRIWLDAKINNQPVRLCFDSGSCISALCPQAVKRLGLRFIPGPTNGIVAGHTEDCTLNLDGVAGRANFPVLDLPANVIADFDGLIGWWTVSPNIVRIDATASEVAFLPKLPDAAAHWDKFSVLSITNSGALDLQVPHPGRADGVICLDTGSDSGLALPAPEWARWREAHPHILVTLKTDFTPSDGFYVTEEAWADKISVGQVILTDVPITRAGPLGTNRWGERYEATLGLAALKRLDCIVDGNSGVAYLHARRTRPPAYSHNRLGAIFIPTVEQPHQAVAQVISGSPADEAGVRNGDVLLRVDKLDVTNPLNGWPSRFFLPAGTRLKLTLKRDGKVITTTATLREILHPDPD
ncbi:MAG: aspartyl protease family protein [Limisphaerales bacterium]